MKTNLLALAVVVAFVCEACSTTYVLTKTPQQTPPFTTQYMSYDELMAKASGKSVTIVMRNGSQGRGVLSHVNADSITWADLTTSAFHGAPMSGVHHLNLSSNFAWEGGAIGLLLLTVPPLAMGAWGPQYPSRLDEPDYSWRPVIVIGGIAGGLAGFGIGSQIKETREFQVIPVAGGKGATSGPTN